MAKEKKVVAAKYTDKSKEQPGLLPIFDTLKTLIAAYAKGNLKVIADKSGQYELYYLKEVEVEGRSYPGLSFATIMIQKGYIGFYFFPIYVNPSLKEKLPPELLTTLKGKTCFYIKENDPVLLNQVKEALHIGYDFYQSRGWI